MPPFPAPLRGGSGQRQGRSPARPAERHRHRSPGGCGSPGICLLPGGSGQRHGRHRRRRRPAPRPGRGESRQARAAGEQGDIGDGRALLHGSGAPPRRHPVAHRQRAQRRVPVPARRLQGRPSQPWRAPRAPHGLRRSISNSGPRIPARNHARRSRGPPQLGHGQEDFGGFRHHDEQRPGSHRGTLVVRCPPRSDRGGHPSPEHYPQHGGIPGWLGSGPALQPRHANAHRPFLGLSGASGSRCSLAGPGEDRDLDFRIP